MRNSYQHGIKMADLTSARDAEFSSNMERRRIFSDVLETISDAIVRRYRHKEKPRLPFYKWSSRRNSNPDSCGCAPFVRTCRTTSDRAPYWKQKSEIFLNSILPVDRGRVGQAGDLLRNFDYEWEERSDLPFCSEHDWAIRDKTSTRSWNNQTDFRRETVSATTKLTKPFKSTSRRESNNKPVPPFDPPPFFLHVYRAIVMYTYTLGRNDLLDHLFCFPCFFRSPLPRTRNLLEYALLVPFLVLNGPQRCHYRLSRRYAAVPRQHTSIP